MQEAAAASQKFTCPSVSAVAPTCTVAINVITVPPSTEDTAFPPEVIERVVAVAEDALADWDPPHQARQTNAIAQRNEWSRTDTFSPATVRRERMPTISRLKQVVLHLYLTQPMRVLFPPGIGPLSICASCFDDIPAYATGNDLLGRGDRGPLPIH